MHRSDARSGHALWLLASALCLLVTPGRAHARRFFRARFETEPLEIELPGEVEVDSQLGAYYGDGQDGSRLVTPDMEIDVGVLSWLEIDLDAALSVTHIGGSEVPAGDPIWLSLRFDAINWKDPETQANLGVGLQVGPRLPSIHTPNAVGLAALVLIGGGTRELHIVGNAGAVFDREQSAGIVYGLDLDYELARTWSLLGSAAAAHYFGDPSQALIAVGAGYKPSERLQLSLLAVTGPFVRGDRGGCLFGASYSLKAWGRRSKKGMETQSPAVN